MNSSRCWKRRWHRRRKDDTAHEMAVTARGLAKAAEILAGQFTLVATNVPYLARGRQEGGIRPGEEGLLEYFDRVHPDAKTDLATCFIERCLDFCATGGNTALVTPQNWLALGTYARLRENLLRQASWAYVARLGPRAFETIGGEVVNVVLVSFGRYQPTEIHRLAGIDATEEKTPSDKDFALRSKPAELVRQDSQLQNPDSRITLEEGSQGTLLSAIAHGVHGLGSKDSPCFFRQFWEVAALGKDWEFLQTTVDKTQSFGGMEQIVFWEQGRGLLHERGQRGEAILVGGMAWRKKGVIISQMNKLCASLYLGDIFDKNAAVILPAAETHIPAVWAFCSSPEYNAEVRKIDQTVKVTNVTLVKVPFDLTHWQKVAAERYPQGLPKPFSNDPTQWLFNGHPKGSDAPLQVAVARLLGYRWPRQTGSEFPDCPALGPDGLEPHADSDGIVCLPPINREPPAAVRLRALLADAWSAGVPPAISGRDARAPFNERELLAATGAKQTSLEDWLRDSFFEQHCKLFHNRPFVWHIWDGRKDGFHALVNCHRLDNANLQKLAYSYLGDWIRQQEADAKADKPGAAERLGAARALEQELIAILEGEPPYDLFIRWKPLAEQPLGWQPDLNDGVRLNIRPFMQARDLGKKGAGILRAKPNIKWDKDRGTEPQRDKADYPWFWHAEEPPLACPGGPEFTGNRWNLVHLTLARKRAARKDAMLPVSE